ncbi:hypothetical protein UFOVP1254_10 [uncultured Caudovirales phage]|uniref:Uncharacterized protein n=1 Tax=uncultured Caudovirales phage TaxID=2100421 RepID=A0A6J5RPR9_9CAUD|nr:hypothetical protein UFOVP1254_10 [uncultured Caudovirales phage]
MKVCDKTLKVDVNVLKPACLGYRCYWPRQNPGVFVQGRGYSNPTKDYLCGNREIRGCPDECERLLAPGS